MNFLEATNTLCDGVTHSELADELGVSVASVRQARLGVDAKARRSPPSGWESAVAKLAERRAKQLLRLSETLKASR